MSEKVTTKFKTIAVVCFTHSVSRKSPNPYAHGGVCFLQARRTPAGKLLGRRVNSNGRHSETGESFELSESGLEHWQAIANKSKKYF